MDWYWERSDICYSLWLPCNWGLLLNTSSNHRIMVYMRTIWISISWVLRWSKILPRIKGISFQEFQVLVNELSDLSYIGFLLLRSRKPIWSSLVASLMPFQIQSKYFGSVKWLVPNTHRSVRNMLKIWSHREWHEIRLVFLICKPSLDLFFWPISKYVQLRSIWSKSSQVRSQLNSSFPALRSQCAPIIEMWTGSKAT